MAISIVWFFLGLLYLGAILVGAYGVYSSYPKGHRAGRVAVYCAGVVVVVGSTALMPTVGTWVWVPIFLVFSLPFIALRSVFGS